MARTSKIVLLREDVDVSGFAEASIKSAEVVDGASIMSTDYLPQDNTVQSSQDLGFLTANLTESEATKLAEDPNVEAVEDDIDVYALQSPPELGGLDAGTLELDEGDAAALESDPFPEYGPGELPFTEAERSLVAHIEPDVLDDVELAGAGLRVAHGLLAGEQVQLAGIPWDKLIKIVRCVLKCAVGELIPGQEISDEQVAQLLQMSGSAEGKVGAPADSTGDRIPQGLSLIGAPEAWRQSTGGGVRVAVCDTGIAPNHPDLKVHGGVSYVPGVVSWADDHYHGTHVAGTIAATRNGLGLVGVAPDAELYAVKVLNARGSGKLSWILNGLAWCYRNRMHVVNLSLGSRVRTHDPNEYIRSYEQAGRKLRRRGILAVAAAGNFDEPVSNPARCPSYMAVAAIDYRRRKASFSNYGPQVELCAPGVSIPSTVPPDGYRAVSGTSMAAPHAAGVAALVKARRPGWHGDKIRVHLWRTALDLGRPGRDPFFGYGQVRAPHAVR